MFQTALHWGAKHGNEDIVKLIAGTYKDYIKGVNETTVMKNEKKNIINLCFFVIFAKKLNNHRCSFLFHDPRRLLVAFFHLGF